MQLQRDTLFLSELNIMDYSLLLGVSYEQINKDRERGGGAVHQKRASQPFQFQIDENLAVEHEAVDVEHDNYMVNANIVEGPGTYYIGIIDMLQKWNTQKKMEKYLKVYLRCRNEAGISCVEPVFYRKRFLKKMSKIGM